MAKVGIKLANGKFYPILDEQSLSAKKLELTTVRDGQPSAQIDFFRSDESAGQTQYIGTLVVDNLSKRYAGETSIDLRVHIAEYGRILAEAEETDGSGGPQKLEVDLNALNADDFDRDDASLDDERDSGVVTVEKRRINPVVPVVIAAIIFLIAAIVFLFLFLSQGFPRPANIYTEPQSREEVMASPPVENDAAKTPEPPPPDPASQTIGSPVDDSRETLPPVTNDTSRKALRTETAR
ncbi:MAG: hypothetical protein LBG27_06905 [Spirochaetaceae bacterium]|jgi:hypothetical protein|nr:hypothetical protein [Spirochaetaceae bacterium]